MAQKFQNTQTSLNRFGEKFAVIGCKDKKGTGFPRGFFTVNGKTFKLEPSNANKEGVDMWIRVTEVKQRTSGGF